MDEFKTIVQATPLISIDFIVKNSKNEILLGKRINRPAKGTWFVPGGRVLKDEQFEQAFHRLIKTELNLDKAESTFKGIYQHFYDDNFSGDNFSTHYVVLAYEIKLDSAELTLPKEQHSTYKWLAKDELLNDETVHVHSKWYFQKDKQADRLFR